ncbi:MAG: PQQ-binding-like beta-propeller repeat protein, partial [Planctomycetia bacterium]
PRIGWASMAGDPETGYLYCHNVSSLLTCYTPDGEIVWEKSLNEEYGELTGYGGRVHTPIIDENRLIVSSGVMANWGDQKPPPKHWYWSFDKRTGEPLWAAAPGEKPTDTTYSCPIVTVVDGRRLLIGGNSDGAICAMKARTGDKLWRFPMSKRGILSSVVYGDGLLFANQGEDNVDSIEFGRVQCLNAVTGESVWRVDGLKASYSTGAVHDGILYMVADLGKLHAFDVKTGKELWVHNLGTVGKGSPVWADGKIYVMEVNGRIHILKPSREKCESLSMVELPAKEGSGTDEIYASPAVADGKVYFVTRDRTLCIGLKDAKPESDPAPALAEEKPVGDKPAKLLVVPYDSTVKTGGKVKLTVQAYDDNGRYIKDLEAAPTLQMLPGASVDKMTVTTGMSPVQVAGMAAVDVDGLKAAARIRAFPPLPWKFDFNELKEKQVPAGWIWAMGKLAPTPIDGDVAMKNPFPPIGKPSGVIWAGPPDMSDYTVQCDVMGRTPEGKKGRQMPDVGIVDQRYTLALLGNAQKLQIESWAPHERMTTQVDFEWDLKKWYTLKIRVDYKDGAATIKGKAWPRDEAEPSDWTISAVDPKSYSHGAPGLYYYALADSFYDNFSVTPNK